MALSWHRGELVAKCPAFPLLFSVGVDANHQVLWPGLQTQSGRVVKIRTCPSREWCSLMGLPSHTDLPAPRSLEQSLRVKQEGDLELVSGWKFPLKRGGIRNWKTLVEASPLISTNHGNLGKSHTTSACVVMERALDLQPNLGLDSNWASYQLCDLGPVHHCFGISFPHL